jgi:hypothetical protein
MTAQVSDVLRFRGEQLRIFTTPLDAFPPERRPNLMPSDNSANWRGYLGLWEIRDDRLYLADIKGSICMAAADPAAPAQTCGGHHRGPCEAREAKVSDFQDGADGAVFADWYSGDLKVPRGKLVEYVHMGFASEYESYLMLTIAQGVLTGERVVAGAVPPSRLQRWLQRPPSRSTARIVAMCVGIVSVSLLLLSFTAFGPSTLTKACLVMGGASGCGDAHFPALLFRIAGFFGCVLAAKLWSGRA